MWPKSSKPIVHSGHHGLKRPGAWIIVILLAPRIIRFFYPEIWVEDDFYLESAYLVTQGMRPYLDFVHPHMPLLEWVAAGYIRILGASHFSLELLNEAAIYATSLLIFVVTVRTAGRKTAALAAILYAFSSLVFRYHVYERECFVAPLLLAATLTALREELPARTQVARQSLFLMVALAIKLTAAIPAAVILGFLAFGRKQWRQAATSGFAVALGLFAFSALLYWDYGSEFLFQTFVFHFMKGRVALLTIATYPGRILDILAPLFVLGVIQLGLKPRINKGLVVVVAIVGAEYLFFGWVSPTAWGHNYLVALPYVAIVAAVGLGQILDSLSGLFSSSQRRRRGQWIWSLGGLALVLVCLAWVTPLVNENWIRQSWYGFGFVPREELSRLSAVVREATAPDEEIIAPAFVCFEANRRELIRYPETYGVYREAKSEFESRGFFKAYERLGRRNFFGLIAATAHYWMEPIAQAVRNGKVNLVVLDSRLQVLPLVFLPRQFLLANGFRRALKTEHFTVWKRGFSLKERRLRP